jgi:hypothetical protein
LSNQRGFSFGDSEKSPYAPLKRDSSTREFQFTTFLKFKFHCCVALQLLVTATYTKVGLIPKASRALPLELFTKPLKL